MKSIVAHSFLNKMKHVALLWMGVVVVTAGAMTVAGAGRAVAATTATGSDFPVSPQHFHHVDVLFVGAHPDDESGDLATFGQWTQAGISVGELTLTRGEGGGDAVGNLSGPPLALWREAEQRRAAAFAGIRNVYYLDKPDIYYTTSAILAARVYNWHATLGKVVRIIRETQPKVIITMNPAPVLGQHGEHQIAARTAIAAYELAANPSAYPGQITREHLKPWAVSRLFIQAHPKMTFAGITFPGIGIAATGPDCATSLKKIADDSANYYGVWAGARSTKYDTTWAQVQVDAGHQYASQGFAVIPPAPTDPAKIRCEWFAQVASRVPFSESDHAATAMLDGAVLRGPGGLPLGTRLQLSASRYPVVPGSKVTVTAHVAAPPHVALTNASLEIQAPAGWSPPQPAKLGTIAAGHGKTVSFTLSVPAGVSVGSRVKLGATLDTSQASGHTNTPLAVVAPVTSLPPLLDEQTAFNSWARKYHLPQLKNVVLPVFPLGSGQSRQLVVAITNHSGQTQSGTVTPSVPAGFSVTPATRRYTGLMAGGSRSVAFTLTNTNAELPVGRAGPNNGNYPLSIRTSSVTGPIGIRRSAINLVPVTTIPEATTQPIVDGTQTSSGEFPGPVLDVSHVWQGPECATASVCSATAKVSWYGKSLYVLVNVKANYPGAILPPGDCNQDWRTDAVGIDIAPKGTYTSDDLSKTLKLDVFPQTDDPANGNPPCAQSSADFHQTNTFGQISTAELMPGLKFTSKVSSPFTGYSIEVKIPFADLPSAVNPAQMGLNIINYYSNNDHRIGTTRLAWSAWSSVQSDPYHWGVTKLAGYRPADPSLQRPVVIPTHPLLGTDSPQSILQAARVGVPLSGAPLAASSDQGRVVGKPRWSNGSVRIELTAAGPGSFNAYIWDPTTGRTDPQAGELGHATLAVPGPGKFELDVHLAKAPPKNAKVAVAFTSKAGGNVSSAASLQSAQDRR